MKIKLLDTIEEEESYINLVYNCNEAMFYHSILYRNLFRDFLESEPCYIIAKENDRVIGAIPGFLRVNKKYGNIINSLPFFGSNGGVLVDSRLNYDEKIEIKKRLIEEFTNFALERDCVLSTIITSPFDKNPSFYENNVQYKFKDARIGQITEFKSTTGDIEQEIMYGIIEKRNRAAIRRPIKNNITIEFSNDFNPLYEMHNENISGKGGIVKPRSFFQKILNTFKEGEFDIMYAKKGSEIIAGLLLFYFKDTVEYFTPATFIKYRKEQGISLLIFKGMKKAIKNGYRYWNFGGTWKTQEGVYKFKRGWGAKDYPYYYYISQYDTIDDIMKLSPEELIKEYKWFYILPFNELKGVKNERKG
jgi:hypothetical protein